MTFLLHDTANECGEADRTYAEQKFSRLDRFLPDIEVVEFHHRKERFLHRADFWLRGGGRVIHVTASSQHLRAAIDAALDRASERMRRIHRRVVGRTRAKLV